MARKKATLRPRSEPVSGLPARDTSLLVFVPLLALAGCLTYVNSLAGSFLFDDDLAIIGNGSLSPWNIRRILHPPREAPVSGRPLVNLSLAVNRALGGLDVRGYHIVNIELHVLCGLLLFAVVRRTLAAFGSEAWRRCSSWIAFAAALLWLVHPLASEPVDYISQRTESMMACAFLLTLYASIRSLASSRSFWALAAIGACAAGMACKESMVVAPVVVALYDGVFVFTSVGEAFRRRWRFYAALGATWSILIVLLRGAPRTYSAGFGLRIGPWDYLLDQSVMIVRYLRLTVWPRDLVLWYGPARAMPFGAIWLPAVLVVALGAVCLWGLARAPRLGFLGAFVFITLAPTSSIVPIATEVGAERRMYLPLMALSVLVVVAAVALWTQAVRRNMALARFKATSVGMVVLTVVALLLAAATRTRNTEYRSPMAMALTVVSRWPTGGAHYMVGTELMALGRDGDAIAEFRQAADTFPRARYYLGAELFKAGQVEEAVPELRAFISEEPLLLEVIPARLKIGAALAREGAWAPAAAEYRQVLAMMPSNIEAQRLLADALVHDSRAEDAFPFYRAYLAERPSDVAVENEFGIALGQTGSHDAEAVAVFRRAAAQEPANAAVRANLARALLIVNDFPSAEREARAAATLDPRSPGNVDLLGQALAMEGHLTAAAAAFEDALRLDPSDSVAESALVQIRHPRLR